MSRISHAVLLCVNEGFAPLEALTLYLCSPVNTLLVPYCSHMMLSCAWIHSTSEMPLSRPCIWHFFHPLNCIYLSCRSFYDFSISNILDSVKESFFLMKNLHWPITFYYLYHICWQLHVTGVCFQFRIKEENRGRGFCHKDPPGELVYSPRVAQGGQSVIDHPFSLLPSSITRVWDTKRSHKSCRWEKRPNTTNNKTKR